MTSVTLPDDIILCVLDQLEWTDVDAVPTLLACRAVSNHFACLSQTSSVWKQHLKSWKYSNEGYNIITERDEADAAAAYKRRVLADQEAARLLRQIPEAVTGRWKIYDQLLQLGPDVQDKLTKLAETEPIASRFWAEECVAALRELKVLKIRCNALNETTYGQNNSYLDYLSIFATFFTSLGQDAQEVLYRVVTIDPLNLELDRSIDAHSGLEDIVGSMWRGLESASLTGALGEYVFPLFMFFEEIPEIQAKKFACTFVMAVVLHTFLNRFPPSFNITATLHAFNSAPVVYIKKNDSDTYFDLQSSTFHSCDRILLLHKLDSYSPSASCALSTVALSTVLRLAVADLRKRLVSLANRDPGALSDNVAAVTDYQRADALGAAKSGDGAPGPILLATAPWNQPAISRSIARYFDEDAAGRLEISGDNAPHPVLFGDELYVAEHEWGFEVGTIFDSPDDGMPAVVIGREDEGGDTGPTYFCIDADGRDFQLEHEMLFDAQDTEEFNNKEDLEAWTQQTFFGQYFVGVDFDQSPPKMIPTPWLAARFPKVKKEEE
ncbi:F-box domain-containing protein [Pseudohyphozyma bogoriensis]|nr:F-box domain-containing protein [Pseudohyphozyma bogoriensis]